MNAPAATLAAYDDAELADWYGASSDEQWHAILEAEMARRDAQDHATAKPDPRAGQRAEWERMAHAQWLDAEQTTRGYLLNARGIAAGIDPKTLWSGPLHRAEIYASEELLRYWLEHPRIDITTFQRQAAGEHRAWLDRHDREASDDQLERDESRSVRCVPDAREGTRARGDSRGNDVPGHPARANAQDHARAGATAGPGRAIRGGPVNMLMHAAERAIRDGRRAEMTRQAQAAREPGTELVTRPRGTVATTVPQLDGAQVLDYVATYLDEFASFASPAARDAVALWAAHSHVRGADGRLAWRATPRLLLVSSEPGSGKTRVLELLSRLSPNVFGIDSEPTVAALAHTLGREHATVLCDEADILFGRGARKEGVRAVLNAGYLPNGTVLKMRGSKADRVPVFGPVALAGLDVIETATGTSLEALLSRCIRIRMRKAAVPVADLTARADRGGYLLRSALGSWTGSHAAELADAEPELPEGVHGRTAEIWTPILAIAEAAGGDWPDRAWTALYELALRGGVSSSEDQDAMTELADMFGELTTSWD